jgi:hypothetical protein
MSRFGWAYVNDVITGSAAAAGPTNSVQFNSGSGVFSGSSNFTFNPSTNVLTVVGTISASNYLGVSGSGGTTSPAGLNKYLQYNSGSVFGASSNLIFDYTTNELILTGNVRVVGQVSASTSLVTSGTISAGSNITSFGIISSSGGMQTSGNIQSVGNITSTSGLISASSGLYSGDVLNVAGVTNLKNNLIVTGSINVSGNISSSAQIQATSLKGDGLNITGVQATNVDGAGNDWSIQFKSGNTGRLTGSANLLFSGSTLTANSVLVTGSALIISASVISASTYLGITSGGSTTPGGLNKAIQFNSGSTFSGSQNLTYDYTTNTLNLTGNINQIGTSTSIIPDDSYILVENPNSGEIFKILSPNIGRDRVTIGSLAAGKDLTVTIQGTNDDYFDITIPTSGTVAQFTQVTSSVGKFDTIILGRTSTSSSISLNSSQHIVAIDTFNALGSVTLSLPNASTLPSGKHYVIKDEGGNANNRNIILSCSVPGQNIDGSSTLTITSPYAAVNIYCDGTSKYFIY